MSEIIDGAYVATCVRANITVGSLRLVSTRRQGFGISSVAFSLTICHTIVPMSCYNTNSVCSKEGPRVKDGAATGATRSRRKVEHPVVNWPRHNWQGLSNKNGPNRCPPVQRNEPSRCEIQHKPPETHAKTWIRRCSRRIVRPLCLGTAVQALTKNKSSYTTTSSLDPLPPSATTPGCVEHSAKTTPHI